MTKSLTRLSVFIIDVDDDLFFIFDDSFYLHLLCVGAGDDTAGEVNQVTQIEFVTKLINGRPFDIARNCRLQTSDEAQR